MLTAAGFEKALAYWPMFLQGVVCTVALSALTVVFGFILALLLAVMRLSNIYPFRSLGLTKDGQLLEQGTPAEIFGNPQCERLKDFLSKVL